jgi:hydroxymethylpyrimidine kinase/phosphomethylpyrimidine kinase
MQARSTSESQPHQATSPAGQHPVALTIAGSDSGGGAGIQADLRAFAFFNVFGTTAITAVTAQNPHAVTDVHAVPSAAVAAQIRAVTDAFTVSAAKTGMLFNAAIIETVADTLAGCPFPLVVDPVMVATSGARLLQPQAAEALSMLLLPKAHMITPNRPEAEILAGRPIEDAAHALAAARWLAGKYECAVVLKGGHDRAQPATDIFCNGTGCWELSARPLAPRATHGTGCTLSAAITACLATGLDDLEAVIQAKALVYGALKAAVQVGPDTWTMTSPAELPLDEIQCRPLD